MEPRKVLIIDDEKGFTSMLKINLESEGYKVRVENDSLKASSTALKFKPDIILLDIIMPQKGGPDIDSELSHNDQLKDIPIIYLTATVAGAEGQNNAGILNGRAFVTKPSNLKQLISSIEEHVASTS